MPRKNYDLYQLAIEPSTEVMDAFEKLLNEKYDYAFNKGDIVPGKVVYCDSNNAYIDVGAKTVAKVPAKELETRGASPSEELTEGESYEFFILREEDDDGQLTLSRRRVAVAYTWKKLEGMLTDEEVIECKVTSVVKGGLLVDIMNLRGFVPSSHVRVKSSFDELVGQTLPFKILTIDANRNNIILSHRKVVSEQLAEQRRDVFSNLTVGSVVDGEVVRLTDFGAFIDLGGVDGLLPLSQMSWRWVEHPSDILKIGDKISVEVIGVDIERQRVSLSIKSQQPDPWDEVAETMDYGQLVKGKITRIKQFGAFVEIHPGVEALLPMKDLSDQERDTETQLEPGQEIETFISKFTPQDRRISLSFHDPSQDRYDDGYEDEQD